MVSSFFQIILQIFFREAFFESENLELGEKKGKSFLIPEPAKHKLWSWSWFSTFPSCFKEGVLLQAFHRGKGVPLKGPFLALFSQGNFGKVNENAYFSVFRIFCYVSPVSLGYLEPRFARQF